MAKLLENLIECLTKQILVEASFNVEDVPSVFWLVTRLDAYSEDFAKQLAEGELQGVAGISGNKMIVPHFFGVARNAILVMPGTEVVRLNKLSRVMYDNPNYLLSKNMIALYRIWDINPADTWGQRRVIENLMDYMKQVTKPWNVREPFGYLMNNYYGGYWRVAEDYQKSGRKINSIHDLAKFLHWSAMNFDVKVATKLSPSDFIAPIEASFDRITKIYKSEGEWLVKDKALKIPAGTRLLIGVPKHPNKFTDEQMKFIQSDEEIYELDWDDAYAMKELRQAIEMVEKHNLDKRYKVKWVDMRSFETIQSKLLVKNQL